MLYFIYNVSPILMRNYISHGRLFSFFPPRANRRQRDLDYEIIRRLLLFPPRVSFPIFTYVTRLWLRDNYIINSLSLHEITYSKFNFWITKIAQEKKKKEGMNEMHRYNKIKKN